MNQFGDGLPFSPLRFQTYARELSKAVDQMIDRDKLRHEYPGGLRTRVIGSDKFVTLGDKTVMVSQMATDDEIAAALHLDQANAPVSATPLPPAPMISTVRKSAPSGSFAASLKAMVDEAHAGFLKAQDAGRARVQTAVNKFAGATAAVTKVSESMATQIEDAADSALSDLGQISNDL